MKKLLVTLALLFSCSGAYAYNTPPGADPKTFPDQEWKSVVLAPSISASLGTPVAAGTVMSYVSDGTATDGYTVAVVPYGTVATQGSANLVACILARPVYATAQTAYTPCVTKGFVDYAKFDATAGWIVGQNLCPDATGALTKCNASVISPVVSAQDKSSGTGYTLKVFINSR